VTLRRIEISTASRHDRRNEDRAQAPVELLRISSHRIAFSAEDSTGIEANQNRPQRTTRLRPRPWLVGHHHIGSGTPSSGKARFVTPSLRVSNGTAPYFRDGRFRTLGVLLRDTRRRMGSTQHLPEADVGALDAFLRRL
jgi:cytochrome c peroxidase